MKLTRLYASILLMLLPLSTLAAIKPGAIDVQSAVGEVFHIEIPFTAISSNEFRNSRITIASAKTYSRLKITHRSLYRELKIEKYTPKKNQYFLRITSPTIINDPSLDLIIEFSTKKSFVQVHYPVLLKKPTNKPMGEASKDAVKFLPGRTYNVKRGDSLYGIANRFYNLKKWGASQAMYAIFKRNPESFENGNMNLLRSKTKLIIPDEKDIGQFERREAIKAVRLQFAKWQEAKIQLNGGNQKKLGTKMDFAIKSSKLHLDASPATNAAKQSSALPPANMPFGVAEPASNNQGKLTSPEITLASAENLQDSTEIEPMDAHSDPNPSPENGSLKQQVESMSKRIESLQTALTSINTSNQNKEHLIQKLRDQLELVSNNKTKGTKSNTKNESVTQGRPWFDYVAILIVILLGTWNALNTYRRKNDGTQVKQFQVAEK